MGFIIMLISSHNPLKGHVGFIPVGFPVDYGIAHDDLLWPIKYEWP